MEALYTALQVKTAVFETSPSKVPGPDGFHAAFFGKEWHVVGPRITKVCLETLNGVSSIAPLNQKHIVLIPKNKTPRRMADYWPISLRNVVYKFIIKTLANRLKTMLGMLTSENQSAFVPRRLISDNLIVAFELMHSMKRKNNGSKGWMGLKLNMSKAYDRVEWGFLDAMMEKNGI